MFLLFLIFVFIFIILLNSVVIKVDVAHSFFVGLFPTTLLILFLIKPRNNIFCIKSITLRTDSSRAAHQLKYPTSLFDFFFDYLNGFNDAFASAIFVECDNFTFILRWCNHLEHKFEFFSMSLMHQFLSCEQSFSNSFNSFVGVALKVETRTEFYWGSCHLLRNILHQLYFLFF